MFLVITCRAICTKILQVFPPTHTGHVITKTRPCGLSKLAPINQYVLYTSNVRTDLERSKTFNVPFLARSHGGLLTVSLNEGVVATPTSLTSWQTLLQILVSFQFPGARPGPIRSIRNKRTLTLKVKWNDYYSLVPRRPRPRPGARCPPTRNWNLSINTYVKVGHHGQHCW